MTTYTDTTFPTGDILDIKPVWSNSKLSTGNYLIKIEEDYKIVTDSFLDKQKLEKVIRTYYPDLSIELFPLQTSTPTLINLMTQPNSFLKTNEITPDELQFKLKQWDEVINYFNKYSDSKINEMFKQTTNKINEERNKIVEMRIGDNTRKPVANAKLYNLANSDWSGSDEQSFVPAIPKDNCFEASGDYINSKELSQIIGYDNNPQDFMEINNFNDSLLESPSQIFNIYFNNQFNNIFVISQTDDFIFHNNKINNLFPEINLLASVELENKKMETIKELNKDIFVNYEDAKSRINRLLNDKIIDSKLSIDEIKGLIKKYFTINTNPSDCIKFTNIWTTISSEIKVSESYINYIKRQLPNILTDLGLQKKRLADGIYWYGLVVRNVNKLKPVNNTFNYVKISDKPVTDEDFNKYMAERNIKFFDSDNVLTSPVKATKSSYNDLLKEVESSIKLEPVVDITKSSENLHIKEASSNKEQINDSIIDVKPQSNTKKQQPKKTHVKKNIKQKESVELVVIEHTESNNSEHVESVDKTKTKTKNSKAKTNKQKQEETESQPPSHEISKVIKKTTKTTKK
jgi:hypothetical protein